MELGLKVIDNDDPLKVKEKVSFRNTTVTRGKRKSWRWKTYLEF